MKLTEAFGTATFRTSAIASGAFAAATLLLYAFIFWQTAGYELRETDRLVVNEARALVGEPAWAVRADVNARFSRDLHRLTFAAIFSPGGALIDGDLTGFPPGLPMDGLVHRVRVIRPGAAGAVAEQARAIAMALPDGRIVVVGRSEAELAKLRGVIWRAFELGVAPAVALALLAGTFASLRTLARVGTINRAIEGIMAGALDQRLPTHGTPDALDQLARGVNRMLDEIARLIGDLQGVGDDIAHDLRTPLTRARTRLDGGRNRAATREDLVQVVDRAIEDLDQSFSLITALLRIGQIESGQRRDGFRPVSLAAIVTEAADLYLPMTELRLLSFEVAPGDGGLVIGDRDLLFELVANLLDNAVKFAPEAGLVRLSVLQQQGQQLIRVQDSGAGIPQGEHAAAMRRFYRADRSRHVEGNGLGLSIVGAILRLHGFALVMHTVHGLFTIDVRCWVAPAAELKI